MVPYFVRVTKSPQANYFYFTPAFGKCQENFWKKWKKSEFFGFY
jgi:hypothetical protein